MENVSGKYEWRGRLHGVQSREELLYRCIASLANEFLKFSSSFIAYTVPVYIKMQHHAGVG